MFLLFAAAGEAGEHFAEADQVGGDAAAGDDEGDGDENHDDADALAQGHALPEYRYAEDYRGDRFEGPEYGCRGGADVLYRACRTHERYGCREYGKGQHIEPQIPFVGSRNSQFDSCQQPDDEERDTEYQNVERNCQGCCAFENCLIDAYYVDGVSKRRGKCKQRAGETQRSAVAAFVQHGYASQSQQQAEAGHHCEFFLKDQRHDQGDHYRVYKKNGGCYAGFHVVVALEERQ